MKNSRSLAVDILDNVFNKGAYSNIELGKELNKSNLDSKDKALVTELVYGTIKYKYSIDKILTFFLNEKLKKLDNTTKNILRTALYQIRYLDKIPEFAAVNEAVNLTKKIKSIGMSKLVNGVLRNYLRNKSLNYYDAHDILQRLCFEYSFNEWMVKLFLNQYGPELTEIILKNLNSTPVVTVRVNNLKSNYEEIWRNLIDLDYNIEEGEVSPEAIRIIKGHNIENNPLFTDGLVTVQDESAMLVAPSMELMEGLTVLDLCSAPGGKATHIAEIMNDKGTIKAFDIHENKLSLIKDNASRLGISSIKCSVLDASKFDEGLENTADRILIDVPCSGLGIIRRKPEIKWTKNNKQLKDITKIQKNIMINSSKYLKAGGILLYSTCTLNKEENEENVRWFINKFPEFKIEKLNFGKIDNINYHEEGFATILPSKSMDGFFIAKLRKIR